MSIKDKMKAKVESNKNLNRFWVEGILFLPPVLLLLSWLHWEQRFFLMLRIREDTRCYSREYP